MKTLKLKYYEHIVGITFDPYMSVIPCRIHIVDANSGKYRQVTVLEEDFNATMKAMQTTMSAAQRVLEDSIKTVREPFKE